MSSLVASSPAPTHQTLRDLAIQPSYRTGRDNLVTDFYVPCLSRANQYDRTAGYFDTKSFATASEGLATFIANDGQIRLIVSPRLRKHDIRALSGTYQWSPEHENRVTDADWPTDALQHWLETDRYGCTSWLVDNEYLTVKVAFRDTECDLPFSHYHEKIGIFTDTAGNTISFSGSVNETGLAWNGNFESVDVFRSWYDGEADRITEKTRGFDELWNNTMPGVSIKPIEVARKDGLGVRHVWNALKASILH